MLTKAKGLFRELYGYAAAIALLNVVGLLALAGFALVGGSITTADITRAIAALRGEGPVQPSDPFDEAASPRAGRVQTVSDPFVNYADAETQMDMEILHREAERIKVELDQRLALNSSIMLKVRAERQTFQNQREAAAKRDEEQRRLVRDEGFEKQVAIFEALSPKVAVQHLLGMNDPDAAAKILIAINADRARKVVEAAKRDPELSQMQVILQRVRDAAPPAPVLETENNG